jgi:hypothetical protein
MAAPRLRLRRGTTAPSGNIALIGEPFVDTTNKNFYVADGESSFVHIGGGTYTARVDEFLTASVASTSVGSVTLKDAQAAQNSVTIDIPSTVTASYNFTLPPDAGTEGYILKTDGSGNTTWVAQSAGYANWVLSDGSNSQTIESTDTVTITGGSGIASTVSATDTVTLDLDINELTALDAEGGADPLVVGDSIAVYDASATGNKKVTVGNLETVIFADVSGDITIASNGVATIAENSVALGTDTTGQYTSTITGGSGIAATTPNGDDGTAYTIDLDINELVALDAEGGADPLVVGDSIPVYDASATGNKKVTVGNLETVIFADVSGDITIATNGTAAIGSGVIVDGDISATAEIAVSKLANGTARQLLQTDAAGTGVEWASNIDVPGTLDVTGLAQFDNNVVITGDLTVNGATTTLSTTNTVISDRLLELANGTTGTPTADSGFVIERGDSLNVFIGFDEGSDLFVAGTTTGTGASTDLAPTPIAFLALQYNVTDAAGTNEAVIAYNGTSSQRELQNVVIDGGTY